MDYKERMRIVGTSHVSKESHERIRNAFADFKPTAICLELDRARLEGLLQKKKSSVNPLMAARIGLTGYVFSIIGRIVQKKIGNLSGIAPGSEMLLGARLAKNNNLKLFLIDQDVALTLRNMSKKVPFREKMRLVLDLILSPFSKKRRLKIDLTKIPEDEVIKEVLKEMKKRYYGLYKVLVEDRNKVMAKRIFLLLRQNPEEKLLVVVGAGHLDGLVQEIDSLVASNLL